jgi:hypothetical protein
MLTVDELSWTFALFNILRLTQVTLSSGVTCNYSSKPNGSGIVVRRLESMQIPYFAMVIAFAMSKTWQAQTLGRINILWCTLSIRHTLINYYRCTSVALLITTCTDFS